MLENHQRTGQHSCLSHSLMFCSLLAVKGADQQPSRSEQEPPATEPQETVPPATKPLETEPPATKPATESPATERQETVLPATKSPETEPPATKPATESPTPEQGSPDELTPSKKTQAELVS